MNRGSDLLDPGAMGSFHHLLLDTLSLVYLPVRNSFGLLDLFDGSAISLFLSGLLGNRLCLRLSSRGCSFTC